MSTTRITRLCGTTLTIVGALGTVLIFAGNDLGEGSLWMPVSVVAGIVILITNRPRKNTHHDH